MVGCGLLLALAPDRPRGREAEPLFLRSMCFEGVMGGCGSDAAGAAAGGIAEGAISCPAWPSSCEGTEKGLDCCG